MPEFKETSRYQIPDPTDPTRWRDLTAPDDEAELDVEDAAERTKLFRVLVPRGRHEFGAEFPMFAVNREHTAMDSSFSPSGELPRREVGIVHKVGVGLSPYVLDQRTADDDIEKVIANAFMSVTINDEPFVEGSLETLPVGYGVAGGPVTNGLPAADATPERFPLLYTNEAMRFGGKLSFPHRKWLKDSIAPEPATEPVADDSEPSDERDCGDATHPSTGPTPCVTLGSDVLVTFYLTGVFGRVRESEG